MNFHGMRIGLYMTKNIKENIELKNINNGFGISIKLF